MKTIRQVKTVFIIFIAFVCCWSPYIVVLVYDRTDSLPLPVHLYTSMLAHLHASLNFAIYGLSNRYLCDRRRYPAANLVSWCLCRRMVRSNSNSTVLYASCANRSTSRIARCTRKVDDIGSLVTVEFHQLQEIARSRRGSADNQCDSAATYLLSPHRNANAVAV